VAPVEMRRRLRQIAIANSSYRSKHQGNPPLAFDILVKLSSFGGSSVQLRRHHPGLQENHVNTTGVFIGGCPLAMLAQQMLLSDLVITG
jgi:hypothetical protein